MPGLCSGCLFHLPQTSCCSSLWNTELSLHPSNSLPRRVNLPSPWHKPCPHSFLLLFFFFCYTQLCECFLVFWGVWSLLSVLSSLSVWTVLLLNVFSMFLLRKINSVSYLHHLDSQLIKWWFNLYSSGKNMWLFTSDMKAIFFIPAKICSDNQIFTVHLVLCILD